MEMKQEEYIDDKGNTIYRIKFEDQLTKEQIITARHQFLLIKRGLEERHLKKLEELEEKHLKNLKELDRKL